MKKSISQALRNKYDGPHERVGFLLKDGTLVECRNCAPEPKDTFDVSPEEILQHCDEAIATWHTHPGAGSNLSVGDRETFLLWPNLLHYIVGETDITCYRVDKNMVVKHEA